MKIINTEIKGNTHPIKNHSQKLRPLLFAKNPEIRGKPKTIPIAIESKTSSTIRLMLYKLITARLQKKG